MVGLEETIRCAALLEKLVSEFYRELSRRAPSAEARAKLLYIARDSEKHAQLLLEFSEAKEPADYSSCTASFGYFFERVARFDQVIKKEYISEDDLRALVSDMQRLENSVGEELFARMVYTMLAKSEFPRRGELKAILELLAEDEERHEKLVRSLA